QGVTGGTSEVRRAAAGLRKRGRRALVRAWRNRRIGRFRLSDRDRGPDYPQSTGCPSPATGRNRHPEGPGADGDVAGVLRAGLHIDGRHRARGVLVHFGVVGDEHGRAVRREGQLKGGRAAMSRGFFVLAFTSMVDTVSLPQLARKAVLPSGVNTNPPG